MGKQYGMRDERFGLGFGAYAKITGLEFWNDGKEWWKRTMAF